MGKLDRIFLKTWGTSDDFVRKSLVNAVNIFDALADSAEKVGDKFNELSEFFRDCTDAAEEILRNNYEPQ